MNYGLIIAAVLAVYIAVLLWRGTWNMRAGVIAAIGLGLLVPTVLAAAAGLLGSAAALLSATGR